VAASSGALGSERNALWGGTGLPFLMDIEVNVRFLIALPLLIVSELVVHQRRRLIVRQFLERNLIPESSLPRFESAIDSALRMRNSLLAELVLIGIVYGFGVLFLWRHYVALTSATWYATPGVDGMTFSLAGIWYVYVSVPIFQFLLVRWYYRIFIWMRFLWQVGRIDLSLIPTHRDRVGGLGFLPDRATSHGIVKNRGVEFSVSGAGVLF
jgi:hypothetical protein